MERRLLKVSRWLSIMSVAAMLFLPAQGFGALTVTSRDIVPADGTTGQDVTVGNGVKTGHIQNGAVTDAKISGTINPSKIGSYTGVKIVHKGGFDNVNTFSSVVDALRALEGATGRNAILVMPGIYEENFSSYIQNGETRNVDIIGSGRNTTTIKVIGSSHNWGEYPDINVPSGLTLQNLTFQGLLAINDGSHDIHIEDILIQQGTGIRIYGNFANVAIEHVTIESTEIGLLVLIASGANSFTVKDVTINAFTSQAVNISNGDGYPFRLVDSNITAGSAFQFSGAAEIVNSRITGLMSWQEGGAALYSPNYLGPGSLTVVDCIVSGESFNGNSTMRIDNSVISDVPIGGNTKLSNSKILNPIGTYGNTVKIVNCADGNYDAIANGTY